MTCHRSHWSCWGRALPTSWGSAKLWCHPRPRCRWGGASSTLWDSSKPRCCRRPGSCWGRETPTLWDSSELTGHQRPGLRRGRALPTSWDSPKLPCLRKPSFRGWGSSTPWDSPRPTCLQTHWSWRGREIPTSWDSATPQCHLRPGCCRGWASSTPWDSSELTGHLRPGSIRGRGPAGLAIRWSEDSGSRWRHTGANPDRSSPLCSPPSVERPPDVVEGLTEVVSADRFLSQVLMSLKNYPFLLASSQKWATATPQQPCKNYRKSWPLCKQVSISHHPHCENTFAIPASARPPSTALPGHRAQQSASLCLGHSQLHWSSGTTVTAKL